MNRPYFTFSLITIAKVRQPINEFIENQMQHSPKPTFTVKKIFALAIAIAHYEQALEDRPFSLLLRKLFLGICTSTSEQNINIILIS